MSLIKFLPLVYCLNCLTLPSCARSPGHSQDAHPSHSMSCQGTAAHPSSGWHSISGLLLELHFVAPCRTVQCRSGVVFASFSKFSFLFFFFLSNMSYFLTDVSRKYLVFCWQTYLPTCPLSLCDISNPAWAEQATIMICCAAIVCLHPQR